MYVTKFKRRRLLHSFTHVWNEIYSCHHLPSSFRMPQRQMSQFVMFWVSSKLGTFPKWLATRKHSCFWLFVANFLAIFASFAAPLQRKEATIVGRMPKPTKRKIDENSRCCFISGQLRWSVQECILHYRMLLFGMYSFYNCIIYLVIFASILSREISHLYQTMLNVTTLHFPKLFKHYA